MNNLHVRHSAPLVLILESARPVRRVTTVISVVKYVTVAVMVDVILTREPVLPATVDITARNVISNVHMGALILVVIGMELATIVYFLMSMD